jgi:hypothetical protein
MRLISPHGTFPLVLEPPYTLDDAACTAFAITAPARGLDRLIDSTFGWAAPHVEVKALTLDWLGVGGVVMVFAHYGAASASGPATGTFSYNEMVVFVPVSVTDQASGTTRPMLHVPYIYPDLVLPLAAGQAVYGFPKKPAILTIPTQAGFYRGKPVTAEVFAAEKRASPWSRQTLFTAKAAPRAESARSGSRKTRSQSESTPAPEEITSNLRGLFSVPLITLKQTPNAGNPPDGSGLESLYRAVVTLAAPLTDISLFIPFLRPIEASFAKLATEPVYEVLGAAPKVLFGGTFTMSFAFEPGEVLYEVYAGEDAP